MEESGCNASSGKKSDLRGNGTFMFSPQSVWLERQFLNVNCLNRNKMCAELPDGVPALRRGLLCTQQPFYLCCISASVDTSVAAQSYFLEAEMKVLHSSLLKTINAEQCCFSFGKKKKKENPPKNNMQTECLILLSSKPNTQG